jgi:ApaG protein
MSSFVKVPAGTDASRGIIVRVVSAYIPQESDLSDPTDRKYVFAYHIDIENRGSRTVRLLSRHWWIVDAHDLVREVIGEGVVGQQPVLSPGQVFSYSSWCVIPTPTGRMRGTYSMLAASGETIQVAIPQFNLNANAPLN